MRTPKSSLSSPPITEKSSAEGLRDSSVEEFLTPKTLGPIDTADVSVFGLKILFCRVDWRRRLPIRASCSFFDYWIITGFIAPSFFYAVASLSVLLVKYSADLVTSVLFTAFSKMLLPLVGSFPTKADFLYFLWKVKEGERGMKEGEAGQALCSSENSSPVLFDELESDGEDGDYCIECRDSLLAC